MKLFNAILNWITDIKKAKEIKAAPGKQPKSKYFGGAAIISAILMVPLTALIYVFFLALNTGSVIITVLGAAGGFVGLVGALLCLINCFRYWGLQVYINKKPITWIALAVIIVCIAVSAVIMMVEFGIF